MSGPIDPKVISNFQAIELDLSLGLDQTSATGRSKPGTLRDCLNFEIVDGNLQFIEGNLPLGTTTLNGAYDIYILKGTKNTDFTFAGLAITDREEVVWYADSVSLNEPLGTGIWVDGTANGEDYVAITAVTGSPPTGLLYFKGSDSAATITITDADYEFQLPNHYYDSLLENVVDSALNQFYLSTGVVETWDAFRPGPLAMSGTKNGISHIFMANDSIYCIADMMVVGYSLGEEKPLIGDVIHIDYPNASGAIGKVLRVEEAYGHWEDGTSDGWLYLYIDGTGGLTEDSATWDNVYGVNADTIQNLTSGNKLGTTYFQTGNYDIKVHKFHGQLWKLDVSSKTNTGWTWVHPGYSVRFKNDSPVIYDQTAPNTEIAPLVVSDAISRLSSSGDMALNTPTEIGSTAAVWAGLANLKADDGTNATCSIPALGYSEKLLFTFDSNTIPETAKITGVTLKYEASASLLGTIYPSQIRMRNTQADSQSGGFGPIWEASNNLATTVAGTISGAAPTVYEFGGDLDLWGLPEVPLGDWNAPLKADSDIEFELEFYNQDAGAPRTLTLDYVFIEVHYTVDADYVYFHNGTSDVAAGRVFAYQVMDGDWSTDDASGWMSFSDIDYPGLITAGCAMYTAASGAGDFLGHVKAVEMNTFPSVEEMDNDKTRCRAIKSSMASEEGQETAYVVNGISPCFAVDASDRVRFIRTPVAGEKDRPRHLAEHRNHLALGLKEHMIVSSVGSPDNMATFDGATTWALRDSISGMHHTTDGTTVVICKDSIHQFQGAAASGSDPFALTTITSRGGAMEYSSVEMGDIYFLTANGMSSVAATDKFGNFDSATFSQGVEEKLRDRLRQVPDNGTRAAAKAFVDCMPVKAKNQIRYFFNDGYVLTATMDAGGERPPAFTAQHYGASWLGSINNPAGYTAYNPIEYSYFDYSPTALFSGYTSWGEEYLLFGKRNPHPEVLRLDQGPIAWKGTTWLYPSYHYGYIELNPLMIGGPFETPSHLESIDVVWETPTNCIMCVFTGIDFNRPIILPLNTAAGGAMREPYLLETYTSTNPYVGDRRPHIGTSYLQNTSYAHTITILSASDWGTYTKPQRIVRVIPKVQPREARGRVQSSIHKQTILPRG